MMPLAAPLHLNVMYNERSRKKLSPRKSWFSSLRWPPLGDGLNGFVLLSIADSEASLVWLSIHLILIYLCSPS